LRVGSPGEILATLGFEVGGEVPLPIDRCLLSLTGIQSLPETSPTEAFAMLDRYTTGLTAAGGVATPVSGPLLLAGRGILRISPGIWFELPPAKVLYSRFK